MIDRRNMTYVDCSWNDETKAFTSTSNAMFVLFVADKPVGIKAFRIHYIINDGNKTNCIKTTLSMHENSKIYDFLTHQTSISLCVPV